MAQVALGTHSPCCGTFAAASGAKSDEMLLGSCGTCGKAFAKANPEYEPPIPTLRGAVEDEQVLSFANPDETTGTITVKGYALHIEIDNVQALVPDVPPVPATPENLTPDNPDAPNSIPVTTVGGPTGGPRWFGGKPEPEKAPDGTFAPENVTQPKAVASGE